MTSLTRKLRISILGLPWRHVDALRQDNLRPIVRWPIAGGGKWIKAMTVSCRQRTTLMEQRELPTEQNQDPGGDGEGGKDYACVREVDMHERQGPCGDQPDAQEEHSQIFCAGPFHGLSPCLALKPSFSFPHALYPEGLWDGERGGDGA